MRKSAPEEGLRWLAQAEEDLKWAKHLAEEGGGHDPLPPAVIADSERDFVDQLSYRDPSSQKPFLRMTINPQGFAP